MPYNRRVEGPVLSDVEGLLLCTCAEPCPDDRSGSIQYQDKEVRNKVNTTDVDTFKNFVLETSGFYNRE
ncbi:MAG TPA: hypothetical protein VGA95_05645 [Thermodesulfobacteriota bacterium]